MLVLRLFHVVPRRRLAELMAQGAWEENQRCARLLEQLNGNVDESLSREPLNGSRLKQHLNDEVKLIAQRVLSSASKLLRESYHGR
jgi:hypothetical protein